MKYIKYLIVFFLSFVFIADVNAVTIENVSNYQSSSSARFYGYSSSNRFIDVGSSSSEVDSDGHYSWWTSVTKECDALGITFKLNEALVKGRSYSITIYAINGPFAPVSNSNNVGIYNALYGNWNNYTFSSSGVSSSSVKLSYTSSSGLGMSTIATALTYTFTAQYSGNYLYVLFKKSSGDNKGYFGFYGYSIEDKGVDYNEALTGEDSDTSSSKCGVICKLKGIWTGIINLPKLIWENLKQGFDSMVNSITNFVNTVKDLFGTLTSSIKGFFENLLTGIIEGLKALFVPTDEQLYEIINDSSKLSENFGFVGESVNFFLNIFTSLLGMVNANGCLELPEFSIGKTSLFEAHTFWNAQQVCLNDNVILSNNITTIRTITSIALVCLFINFAASKFFGIISKVDSDQARTDSYEVK